MKRKQLISIFFIVLLVYILFHVLLILSPFLQPIFWGMIIAFAFYPLYEKTLRWTNQNHNLSAALITCLVLLIFTPLVILIIAMAIRETVHFYEWLGQFIQNGDAEKLIQKIHNHAIVKKIENSHLFQWETFGAELKVWMTNSIGMFGNSLLKNVTLLTKNTIQVLLSFFLTFFLVFFFLRDGRKTLRFIFEITPLDENNKNEIFAQLSETFAAVLRGQLFTGLAQAAILGIVFWILHLPLPIFFAALAFLAAMIPIIGASAVWVPFAVYLFLTQDYPRGIALLILGVLVISGVDNVLKPMLIGQKAKLPYSLLFLGILGGIHVYGVMGVFLAPALLSLFFVLVKIYREKFSESES